MAVDRATKRIRPADFQLSQIQDNLANALDSVLTTITRGGFRRTLQMGTYWVGNAAMATTDVPFIRTVSQSTTTYSQTMVAAEVMPCGGSVLSMQAFANGPVSDKWTVTLYKNGKATALMGQTKGTQMVSVMPQGKLPFVLGDVLMLYIRGSASTINQSFSASIDVESQA